MVAATDTQLERRVAIKFLLPEYAKHNEASIRFMREARAAVKIQSEHIARVIDVNEMENGSPYMVMEYLEGGDLSQIIERQGPLSVQDAAYFVLQASEAIAEAHSYGIVHRDLKPANLFLAKQADGSSKVKVLDFGISKKTVVGGGMEDASLTRTSSMMGSPLYMSPEQMRSTKDVDARTDIWALGVILHELLTARPPFDADSIPELSAKILLEDPTPITRSDVPETLKLVILKALTKDPRARFPSVAEFSMALAEFAPQRARTNVERISRILTAAGMTKSHLDLPPSVPPGMGLQATNHGRTGGGSNSLRAHAGTVADFTRTQSTETRSSSGAGKWIAAAAVSVLLLGGGALFVVMSAQVPVAEQMALTGAVAAIAPTPPVQGPAVSPVLPEAAAALEPAAATEAVAPPSPPVGSAAATAAAPSTAAPDVVNLPPSVQKPAARTAVRARQEPIADSPPPAAVVNQSPKSPVRSPSLRDKWGGRK
ncbi:MAG: hypothetical protein RJA70_4480 [Pseudomonadota bacterium]